jgi:plasmid maintenance system antidote protein VapI
LINRIFTGRASVSADMIIKLGAALRMRRQFWLNARQAVDICKAAEKPIAAPDTFHL